MKGVAHRDALRPKPLLGEDLNGLRYSLAGAADYHLVGAVDVGGHDIPVDFGKRLLYGVVRRDHRSHPAIVIPAYLGHLSAAGSGGLQRIGKWHDAGRDQGTVFAQGMAHGHIWSEAIFTQELVHSRVHGQHRRLGDGGLHQVVFRLLHDLRVVAVDKEVAGQGPPQDGSHHLISLSQGRSDHRLDGGQLAAHIGVLAALARIEEGDLARSWPAAAEDTLGSQRLPGLGIVKAHGLSALGQPIQQLRAVAEIDHQSLRRVQVSLARHLWGRSPATLGPLPGLVHLVLQLRRAGRPNSQDVAHRCLGPGGGRPCHRAVAGHQARIGCPDLHSARPVAWNRHAREQRRLLRQHAGYMFLQHQVEVGTAEAVGAHAGTPRHVGVALAPLP